MKQKISLIARSVRKPVITLTSLWFLSGTGALASETTPVIIEPISPAEAVSTELSFREGFQIELENNHFGLREYISSSDEIANKWNQCGANNTVCKIEVLELASEVTLKYSDVLSEFHNNLLLLRKEKLQDAIRSIEMEKSNNLKQIRTIETDFVGLFEQVAEIKKSIEEKGEDQLTPEQKANYNMLLIELEDLFTDVEYRKKTKTAIELDLQDVVNLDRAIESYAWAAAPRALSLEKEAAKLAYEAGYIARVGASSSNHADHVAILNGLMELENQGTHSGKLLSLLTGAEIERRRSLDLPEPQKVNMDANSLMAKMQIMYNRIAGDGAEQEPNTVNPTEAVSNVQTSKNESDVTQTTPTKASIDNANAGVAEDVTSGDRS